jgi:hypothetical protein
MITKNRIIFLTLIYINFLKKKIKIFFVFYFQVPPDHHLPEKPEKEVVI